MKLSRGIYNVICLLVIAITIITSSYAWFLDYVIVQSESDFSGASIISYFYSGTGTEKDPYIINSSHHLYNLAWLQNAGAFGNTVTYFKLADANGDSVTIDMAGEIDGESGISGAIPPIGSPSNPFLGHFDGNGSVISNLWVSTLKQDWKEKPEDATDYNDTHVGLFGAISGTAIVSNFKLDRAEIKTHTSATIGIICGLVDAYVANVGVYNGIITTANGATVNSDYTLIGAKTSRVIWEDMPELSPAYGGAGGDLFIDPSDYDHNGAKKFVTLNAGEWDDVPYSIPGTAYYAGSLVGTAPQYSKGNKKLWDLTQYSNGQGYKDFVSDGSIARDKIASAFEKYDGSATIIKLSNIPFDAEGAPVATEDVPDAENVTISIPQNGIWFKPVASGTVGMAFAATNNSEDRYVKLYACKRDSEGNLYVVEEKSVEYILPVSEMGNKFKNGQVAYYEYEVTTKDVTDGYEYVIGATNVSGHGSDVGFFMLMLAGTDTNAGPEEGVIPTKMFDVDYVISPTVDLTQETYVNHKTLLRINSFTATEETKLYFLAAGALNESLVYYYTPSSSYITDISYNKKSSRVDELDGALGNTGASFQERETTAADP